jgi:hypothetical protein
MTYDKIYFPYPSTDKNKKFFIITNQGKKIRFGAKSFEHFTEIHLDEERKQRYLNRHKKREDWEDPNTAGYWSARYLWLYPSYEEAYQKIKEDLLKNGYITKEQYEKNVWKG